MVDLGYVNKQKVIGNDLSPIQPTWVPPNLRFEVDDAESTWPYKENSFDYIHTRFMAGSVANWSRLIKQAYKHTAPGGIVELQEPKGGYYSEDNSVPPDSAMMKWMDLFVSGANINKRPVGVVTEFKTMMEEAGFINVHVEIFRLPHSPWPKDRKLKEIGAFNLVNMLEGLQALSLFLFTKVHGWSAEEVGAFLPEVTKDLHKKEYHALSDMYVFPPLPRPFSWYGRGLTGNDIDMLFGDRNLSMRSELLKSASYYLPWGARFFFPVGLRKGCLDLLGVTVFVKFLEIYPLGLFLSIVIHLGGVVSSYHGIPSGNL